MKFSFIIIQLGLLTILFGSTAFATTNIQPTQAPAKELIVETDKVFDPNVLTIDSIQAYEPKFDFDWNNYTTIQSNKKKIAEVETFLKTNHDFSKLSSAEQLSLGRILY